MHAVPRLPSALLLGLSVAVALPAVFQRDVAAEDTFASVLRDSGFQGGLVVYLGDASQVDPTTWPHASHSLVFVLDTNAQRVAEFRKKVHAGESSGNIVADVWTGGMLPVVDRLVTRLIISKGEQIAAEERDRVLSPGGLALTQTADGWERQVKQRPATIDDWTHFFHDAAGSAVAHDQEVGPPKHLQWLGSPRWSRHHDRMASMSALVSSNGRMFYIVDEGSRTSIQLPSHWKLVARDAFNGVILWKRPIDRWHNHLWPLKSGPTQLARRLVATPDSLYVTLGLRAPISRLAATTGEIVQTYDQTNGAEELIVDDGTLFALVNPGESELESFVPANNVGDQRRVAQEWLWNERPRLLTAVDTETGETQWQRETRVAPLSLTVGDTDVVFHNGDQLVSLDRESGKRRWSVPAPRRQRITMNFGPRVVLYEDVVLYAGGDRQMFGFDRTTGRQLWNAQHPPSGYESPEDLLVVGGLVWSAPTRSTRDSGNYVGRDPRTGEVKAEFPPDVETYWFHHRCYMAKATDRFLMPSRTGIEFVDPTTKSWTINHWVRGGCLYGVMPCNGLVYTPPHDCACYPEAKLWGLNALAPHSAARTAAATPSGPRLVRGPAYDSTWQPKSASKSDWPTYRKSHDRHGHTAEKVSGSLQPKWQASLRGKLSAPVAADGRVYVTEVDRHAVHAIDETNGEIVWSFLASGRIDSPPTWYGGRIVFGSADGYVYCLDAERGELVWKFRAAPTDMRLVSMEQIESVWPVHGSILVDGGDAYFVAGRSVFLDGGIRFCRVDMASGALEKETLLNDVDAATGEPLQSADNIKILNMPVGLPDILATDGREIFMRSQRLTRDGVRLELEPVSGDPVEEGASQRGPGLHLFAPLGFVDDSWFHRGYWVWGRHFAGGHAGYYQAGRFTPSGRLLVVDDHDVFGFARKPQYYKWTTVLEHQLYRAAKAPPEVDESVRKSRRGPAHVAVTADDSFDPAKKPITVAAWVYGERPSGTIVAHGGSQQGYALDIRNGRPRFLIRRGGSLTVVRGRDTVTRKWVHLAGVLRENGQATLYVNGKPVAQARVEGTLPAKPKEDLQVGADLKSTVGNYAQPNALGGVIDEVAVYFSALAPEQIEALAAGERGESSPALLYTFDRGKADDKSGHGHHGTVHGALAVQGQRGGALRFRNTVSRGGNSFVTHHWTRDLPIFVEAMVSAGDRLLVCGPPDVMDEEETFERIMRRDPTVQKILDEQDRIWTGQQNSQLLVLSKLNGETLQAIHIPGLVRWDGLAVANGHVFVTTTQGAIHCLRSAP